MRRFRLWPLLFLALVSADAPRISVYFSPNGGCTDAIVREVRSAKSSILVEAYSFTSTPIVRELIDAQRRGIKVRAILDSSNQSDRYTGATALKNGGAEVWIDAAHAIAHSKVLIIDDVTVITGSFNFSSAAENKNHENLLVIHDASEIAKRYVADWEAHRTHSVRYRGVESAPPGTPEKRTAPSPSSQAGAVEVFVTPNGKRYHAAGCSSLKGGGRPIPLETAKAQGLTPCQRCRPRG